MRVMTPEEMRETDGRAVRDFGISEEILMERAGMAVSRVCREWLGRTALRSGRRPVLAVAGGGHNGADSLVALRDLVSLGYSGEAFVVVEEANRQSPALLREIDRLRRMEVPVRFPSEGGGRHRISHAGLIIDGILGTGFRGELPEDLLRLVEAMNQSAASGIPVVSVDIPSGVDGRTGAVGRSAVRAATTVTFGAPKWGLLVDPGTRYAGEIRLSRIGFPSALLEGGSGSCLTIREAMGLLPRRYPEIHKGQAGHVLIAGGSFGKAGAPLLAARGALRAGAGLVTLLWDRDLSGYSNAFPEVMGRFFNPSNPDPGAIRGTFEGIDAMGCGPGLPDDEGTRILMETLLSGFPGPVVADAGTFSLFAGRPERVAELRGGKKLVLTPHPGELGRFLGVGTPEVLKEPLDMALSGARKANGVLLLKGARTLVVDAAGRHYVNLTGDPVMAGAGMGDVLTGMIAAFLGQGMEPFEAACLGAFIHGAAGERLGRGSSRGRLASELADEIPGLLSDWEPLSDPPPLPEEEPLTLWPVRPPAGGNR
jgi:NAD(P)H-hydrate epimerase